MIRYIRQNDNFRCGPIAALNLHKWLGNSVSYAKNIKKFERLCKCDKEGTTDADMISGLEKTSKNQYTVSEIQTFKSLSPIQNHVEKDGAIILSHRSWDEPDADHLHFSLLVPDDEYYGYVTWINSFAFDHPHTGWIETPTAINVSFFEFEKLLMSKQRIGDKITGILITKNE